MKISKLIYYLFSQGPKNTKIPQIDLSKHSSKLKGLNRPISFDQIQNPKSQAIQPQQKKIFKQQKQKQQSTYIPQTVRRTIITSSDLLQHHRVKKFSDQQFSSELESDFFEQNEQIQKLSYNDKMKYYVNLLDQKNKDKLKRKQ